MATQKIKFLDQAGKEFDTAEEADASDARLANEAAVSELVQKHFPSKPGSERSNPHARTAARAIYLWIARSNQPAVEIEA